MSTKSLNTVIIEPDNQHKITLDISEQLCIDVIDNAMSGPIDYWCYIKWHHQNPCRASIVAKEDLRFHFVEDNMKLDTMRCIEHLINPVIIGETITRICNSDSSIKVSKAIKNSIITAVSNDTTAELDAIDVDSIIQIACFSEVVYS